VINSLTKILILLTEQLLLMFRFIQVLV